MDPLIEKLPPDLREPVGKLIEDLRIENRILREQLRLTYLAKYGRRSEKLSAQQLQLLEGEPSVTEAEVEREAQQSHKPAAAPRRKVNHDHPGRVELPAHLERRDVLIPCSSEEACCPHCPEVRPVIGYEVVEELDVEPAVYFVRVTKREKRGSHCYPEDGVKTAPGPTKIIPKSKLSDRFIIDALIKKFDEHLPAYRQCSILEREAQVILSRQTLVQSMMAAADLLRPVSEALAEDLLKGSYIQADETPVPCQSGRTRGRNHQAYMWEYSRPGGPVVFDFRMGRGRDGPAKFLNGFSGKLQCDGYGAYDKLPGAMVYVGCWAHVRRAFYKAHQVAPQDPGPLEVLGEIKNLYRLEEQCRQNGTSAAGRQQLRQQISVPIVQGLKERIVRLRQQALPKSALGKACQYALGQWPRLEEVFQDGQLELDNNWCENAIRPLALGRKNWLHIGSELAGPKVAAVASVMETCRRLSINVRDYLSDVLPRLPDWPRRRVAELSPLFWSPGRSP